MGSIRHFRELDVDQMTLEAAMYLFELAKRFPVQERFSIAAALEQEYENMLGKLVTMLIQPEHWTIRTVREQGGNYG